MEMLGNAEHARDLDGRAVIGNPADNAIDRRLTEIGDDFPGQKRAPAKRETVFGHGKPSSAEFAALKQRPCPKRLNLQAVPRVMMNGWLMPAGTRRWRQIVARMKPRAPPLSPDERNALTREERAVFGEPRRMRRLHPGPSFEARKSAHLRMTPASLKRYPPLCARIKSANRLNR